MSEDARHLALYLLTSPHSNIIGAFRLPDGYVCEDLQWSPERVAEGFAELLANGFANRCGTTKWVWIYKHLEWNQPENPNQRKSAAKIAMSVPDECAWKADFIGVNGELLGVEGKPLPNPSATVSEPFLNQKQEQEQKEIHVADLSAPAPASLSVRHLVAEGVEAQHAQDWLKVRKAQKAPLTQTAWDGLKAEALKAGITPGQAVEVCATNAWRGFKAEWLKSQSGKPQAGNPNPFAGAI